MKVVVIGASQKPQRYSYKAIVSLKENKHDVFPVHPKLDEIEGLKVYRSINDIPDVIDTITMYVGAKISTLIEEDIISKKPKRIIFNPGVENPSLENRAKNEGIEVINACTLVMLNSGQF